MNCEILHTLYIRSNGDVPCNDDAGESVLLGRFWPNREKWTVHSLLSNHRFRHIRTALQGGTPPWPACQTCAFFRPNEAYADPLEHRQLRKIQVEPSLACRLSCPGCSNRYQIRVRNPPYQMDPGLFEQVLQRLHDEGYSVGTVEYCGQGEPLLHPRFSEFLRLVQHYLPGTHQRLITSGNFEYERALQGQRLSEVMVSCDGLYAGSYARYRVGGEVERPLRFMRDALAAPAELRPIVVWKYILFEWNDSADEIRAAQELAQEMHVDALLFVYTHSKGKSTRYTLENPGDFPIYASNVVTNATPVHYRQSDVPGPVDFSTSETSTDPLTAPSIM